MGDIAEDMAEALRVIDAYVDACETVVEERWTMSEGLGTEEEVEEAREAAEAARTEMEETVRALIDPRACP